MCWIPSGVLSTFGIDGILQMSSQGCTEGLPAARGDSIKLKKGLTEVPCPAHLSACTCVNEIVPVTDCRKGRGSWGFGQASHSSTLACGVFNFFFFFPPSCLSSALSGLIGSVCNSGSKLIFESTLSLFSPRYRRSCINYALILMFLSYKV